VADVSRRANQLFYRLLSIPFLAKFVVFARAPSDGCHPQATRLHIFCVTDDKLDKTLERRQKYHEVARSQLLQVTTTIYTTATLCLNKKCTPKTLSITVLN